MRDGGSEKSLADTPRRVQEREALSRQDGIDDHFPFREFHPQECFRRHRGKSAGLSRGDEDFGKLLHLLRDFLQAHGRRKRSINQSLTGVRKHSADGFFADDSNVVSDVGQLRHTVSQFRDIGRTPRYVEFSCRLQTLNERHQFDRLVIGVEVQHSREDALILRDKKITDVELFGGRFQGGIRYRVRQ